MVNVPIAPVISGMAIPILRPSMRDSSVCLLYTLIHKSSNVQTNERNRDIKGLTIKKENTVDARMKPAYEVPVENVRKSKNLSAKIRDRAMPCKGLRTRSFDTVIS
jgi:hypothetical protein